MGECQICNLKENQSKLLSSAGDNNLCIELSYGAYKIISIKDNYTNVVKCKIKFCLFCGRKL